HLADSCLELIDGDVFTSEVLLHEFFIRLSNGLNELLAVLVSTVNQVSWDLSNGSFGADRNLARPHESRHVEPVNNAADVVFSADWPLDDDEGCAKAVNDGGGGVVEVCPHIVDLANEADTWDVVLRSLQPNLLGVWLNAFLPVERSNG